MSGMGSTLQLNNPTVVAAFRSALIHQGIIALLIFFLLAMLWVSVREWVPGSRPSFGPPAGGRAAALPGRAATGPRLGRAVLAGTGLFLAGMAQIQAWPGNGFWSGTVDGKPGNLASMVQGMAQTSQPRFLSSLVNAFGTFAAQILPAGGMIGHSDIAYVIDRSGRTRSELNFDPGPGTSSTQASFASELSTAAQQTLGSS